MLPSFMQKREKKRKTKVVTHNPRNAVQTQTTLASALGGRSPKIVVPTRT